MDCDYVVPSDRCDVCKLRRAGLVCNLALLGKPCRRHIAIAWVGYGVCEGGFACGCMGPPWCPVRDTEWARCSWDRWFARGHGRSIVGVVYYTEKATKDWNHHGRQKHNKTMNSCIQAHLLSTGTTQASNTGSHLGIPPASPTPPSPRPCLLPSMAPRLIAHLSLPPQQPHPPLGTRTLPITPLLSNPATPQQQSLPRWPMPLLRPARQWRRNAHHSSALSSQSPRTPAVLRPPPTPAAPPVRHASRPALSATPSAVTSSCTSRGGQWWWTCA